MNPLLGLLLVGQVVVGLCNEVIPHETFEWLHATGGIALAVAAVLHLALNWNWVKTTYFAPRPNTKA